MARYILHVPFVCNQYADTNSDTDEIDHTNSNIDTNDHANSDSYADGHTNSNSNSNSYVYPHCLLSYNHPLERGVLE